MYVYAFTPFFSFFCAFTFSLFVHMLSLWWTIAYDDLLWSVMHACMHSLSLSLHVHFARHFNCTITLHIHHFSIVKHQGPICIASMQKSCTHAHHCDDHYQWQCTSAVRAGVCCAWQRVCFLNKAHQQVLSNKKAWRRVLPLLWSQLASSGQWKRWLTGLTS